MAWTRDQVLAAATEDFAGDALAAATWADKYALRDADDRFLERTPDAMHRRLARAFAQAEARYPALDDERRKLLSPYGQRRAALDEAAILRMLDGFRELVPQGSVMAGLGDREHLVSLSNCVVLPPPHDSYAGILHVDQQLAQLCKRRCGVGFDLSTLRPEGAPVHNAARTSSGAVSFMDRYSHTVREVAQQGRRGALMLTLHVAHPDILAFIRSKQDLTRITGANISVRVTDAFLEAVERDAPFTLRWPVEDGEPAIRREVPARLIWDELVACAHRTAEPGVLFWDRQHRYSTSSVYLRYRNAGTNPCSEIAMQGGDSCRLMALNLYGFVREPFTPHAHFDHARFAEVTYEAMRLMDDLVDLELTQVDRILAKLAADPVPEELKRTERSTWELLRENGEAGRRTGLGFTGLADALAALGLRYGSQEAVEAVRDILRTKCRADFDSSVDLAIERGCFAGFDPEVERTSAFTAMLEEEFPDVHARMMRHGRRHVGLSTVAPTGSVSLLTRTSSGIEPVYRLRYTRRRKVDDASGTEDALGDRWTSHAVLHGPFADWQRITGRSDPAESPWAGATAPEVDPAARIALQAMVQRYTTHGISSTLNLPEDTSPDTVAGVFLHAWKAGLKGVTVYREGCRDGVLVAKEEEAPLREPQDAIRCSSC